MKKNKVTIIIPCYNEEKNLILLYNKVKEIILNIKNYDFDYLFIDDGSYDKTFEIISKLSLEDNNVRGIQLSRNFGSHVAISAGIENVDDSDSVIVISADLQEPPELIVELIDEWNNDYEVVWTIRKKRDQGFIGKLLSSLFYKFFIKFSELKDYPKGGPATYFLLDKKVYTKWIKFKESNRQVLGMISWMGFKQTIVEYKQEKRKYGKSSYNFLGLIKLAIDSFVGYSFAPIRAISLLGILISIVSFLYAIYLVFQKIFYEVSLTGWTSIMVIVLLLGGLQLITLGIIGEYVWRGVNESRNRPLYIIAKKINFD